ncbi:DotU/TssL family secretion system protein [Pantoea sp. FN060301]|uniref:DotU/TssL family secretion system protein n=1 Tax=Pantoea sp. FN060301 TaxID=3420380 RepID=UPI003D182E08
MASYRDISSDPVCFTDLLLQDTVLFVIDTLHNKELKRDATFYQRGCKLVEALKAQLERLKVSDEFSEHMLHAQCCLIDETVLSTASPSENHVWLAAPLQSRYLGTMHAGEQLPDRLKMLLRQPAPDMRLLVLYQRIFAMGFGRHSSEFKEARRQFMESLDALVPAADVSLSAPLLVEHRPGVREGIFRARLFHTAFLVVATVALWFWLSHSLSAFLHNAFSG